jgi:hypothetical protein
MRRRSCWLSSSARGIRREATTRKGCDAGGRPISRLIDRDLRLAAAQATPAGGGWSGLPWRNRKRRSSYGRVSIPCVWSLAGAEPINASPTKAKQRPVKAQFRYFGPDWNAWARARCFVFHDFNTSKRTLIYMYMHIGAYVMKKTAKNIGYSLHTHE